MASQFPRVRLVYGNLDSAELLEEEARKADIVLREALQPSSRVRALKRIPYLQILPVPTMKAQ